MSIRHKFMPAAVVADGSGLSDRQILVIASDATVGRVGDVLVPRGCRIQNYLQNPIVLADHDTGKPIGTAHITITDDKVMALITFAPPGISQKADEYCGLAKAGVLGAVSLGVLTGILTPNEVRHTENLPPKPGADQLLVPSNTAALGSDMTGTPDDGGGQTPGNNPGGPPVPTGGDQPGTSDVDQSGEDAAPDDE